jgi:nucleoside-diphosphate-sugar epimerase
MTTLNQKSVTVLGVTGHCGLSIAKAFLAAGWQVRGMARKNRKPIPGVTFVAGDANNIEDMKAAVADSAFVVHALNLPYHEWDEGRMETQMSNVLKAVALPGRTLLYPGNIYNYAATDRKIYTDTPQHPETPRGAIKVRCEEMLRAHVAKGDMQAFILRAGDFYGPDSADDFYDLAMLREANKGKIALMGERTTKHTWAYLPDFAEAFVKTAAARHTLAAFENFHFKGHFISNGALAAAIQNAASQKLKVGKMPWGLLRMVGLFQPMMRELCKMQYLWSNEMALVDPKLDALLGEDFGTPMEEAVATTARPFFGLTAKAAA